MTKAVMPKTNQVYYNITRPFSSEGFHKLDVPSVLHEMGYSNSEAGRLLNNNAVKIWDTMVSEDGNHIEWFKRKAQEHELVESNEVLIVGKGKFVIVGKEKVNIIKRFWWYIRPFIERNITDKIRYDIIKKE